MFPGNGCSYGYVTGMHGTVETLLFAGVQGGERGPAEPGGHGQVLGRRRRLDAGELVGLKSHGKSGRRGHGWVTARSRHDRIVSRNRARDLWQTLMCYTRSQPRGTVSLVRLCLTPAPISEPCSRVVSRARKRTGRRAAATAPPSLLTISVATDTACATERQVREIAAAIRSATRARPRALVARYSCGHATHLTPRGDPDTLCHCGRGDLLGVLEAAA